MSKVLELRCLVNERLTAAVEEIFALFERTIAEYEEELCGSKEENQRKQHILDSVLSPRVLLHRTDAQIHLMSAGPSLNQELTETPQIKQEPEEHSIKQEEEQLQEFTAVCVKSEEQSSLLQQRQSDHREETQGEECEGHLHSEQHTDNDEDCSSTPQMDTEADGHHNNQVTCVQHSHPVSHFESSPETGDTVRDGDISGSDVGVKMKKHQCSVCKKRFSFKQTLREHTRIHAGEKPYSCSVCQKTFALKRYLKKHMTTHTGEKPYSCSVCQKTFSRTDHVKDHMIIHSEEKPYSCSVCQKKFVHTHKLKYHMNTHTGEQPYSCTVCQKSFARPDNLKYHVNTHTGEQPYSCSVCQKIFSLKNDLKKHMRMHTGERPYCCSVCQKTFARTDHLKYHMTTHTGEKPYSCSICQRIFTLKGILNQHMKKHHKGENI